MPSAYMIDANLLVLLTVGLTDRDMIADHRRLRRFSDEDFDTLISLLELVDEIYVTPNTLTETSNLLGFHRGSERGPVFETLRQLIDESIEVVVPSRDAAKQSSFVDVGLTDAGLLTQISEERPLLTVDLELFGLARMIHPDAAVNFTLSQNL